jgi:cell division protein FtsB
MEDMYKRRREQRRRERRQQISSFQIVFVAILAIGLLLAINFSARIRRGQVVTDLKVEVEATITALEAENLALRQEHDFVQSDASIVRWAQQEQKMVRPGEILVIPYPGIVTPEPAIRTTQEPRRDSEREEVSTWELWWSLFFDGDPP